MFQPHNPALADKDGMPTLEQAYYYAERAKGGVGLVIIENAAVHITGKMSHVLMHAWDPKVVPGLAQIADMVHAGGSPVFGQLNHGGHSTAVRPPQLLWAPTQLPEASSRYNCKEMEEGDLQAAIEGFALGARHYKEAGFDGVEIKAAAHDGLLRSFVSPHFNRRVDDYGGTFENRMRLPLQVVRAVREEIGEDYPLGLRICLDEFTPWGYDLDYGLRIVAAFLEGSSPDYLNTDAGTFSSFYMEVPPAPVPLGFAVYMAAAVRQMTELPVIAFGRLGDPDLAEKVLTDGYADLIGMCRPLVCDPELPSKARAGKLREIRHCIACNDGCLYQVMQDRPIRCIQNPATGRERYLGLGTLRPAKPPRRILVIGGGIAGLKVAAVASERGHSVTLVEKHTALGGQIRLAARQPFHQEISEVPRRLEFMAKKHGTLIQTDVEATTEFVLNSGADVVVVATGSRPSLPEGVRIDPSSHVYPIDEILDGRSIVGAKILVYDETGHWPGAGTAEYLLQQGKQVIIATPLLFVGFELEHGNREMFYLRVRPKGLEFLPSHALQRIDGTSVTLADVYSEQTKILKDIAAVVFAGANRSNDALYRELKGKVKVVHRVGDAVAPRMIQQVMYEAELLGRSI